MVWQQWVYAAWAAFGILLTICSIGRERQPITPGLAAASVATLGLLAWLVLSI